MVYAVDPITLRYLLLSCAYFHHVLVGHSISLVMLADFVILFPVGNGSAAPTSITLICSEN